MSIVEMHYDFDLKIDKVASLNKSDFNVAEKDWLLNEGQNVYIKTKYSGNNVLSTGFETTQKRIDDLSSLVVKYPKQSWITPTELDEGVYEMSLADLEYPYWFFIRGQIEVAVSDSCSKLASLKIIQHDDLNYLLNDPFNNSSIEEVISNFGRSTDDSTTIKSSLYIYPGNLNIGRVKLEYIKQPAKLNYGGYAYIDNITYSQQSCELPEHTHPEIVDIAVQIASGIIESPDYVQLKTQKVFSNE